MVSPFPPVFFFTLRQIEESAWHMTEAARSSVRSPWRTRQGGVVARSGSVEEALRCSAHVTGLVAMQGPGDADRRRGCAGARRSMRMSKAPRRLQASVSGPGLQTGGRQEVVVRIAQEGGADLRSSVEFQRARLYAGRCPR